MLARSTGSSSTWRCGLTLTHCTGRQSCMYIRCIRRRPCSCKRGSSDRRSAHVLVRRQAWVCSPRSPEPSCASERSLISKQTRPPQCDDGSISQALRPSKAAAAGTAIPILAQSRGSSCTKPRGLRPKLHTGEGMCTRNSIGDRRWSRVAYKPDISDRRSAHVLAGWSGLLRSRTSSKSICAFRNSFCRSQAKRQATAHQ